MKKITKICSWAITLMMLFNVFTFSVNANTDDLSDMGEVSTAYDWYLERTLLVQRFLNFKINAGVNADGICGNQTKFAIQDFQASSIGGSPLTADGVVGTNTWLKINGSLSTVNRGDPFGPYFVKANSSSNTTVASYSYGYNAECTWCYAYGDSYNNYYKISAREIY